MRPSIPPPPPDREELAANRRRVLACGCLGSGGVLPTGQSTSYPTDIAVVAVLLVLAAGLARWPRTRFALDDAVRRSAGSGLPEVRVGPRRTAEARRRQCTKGETPDRQRYDVSGGP